MNTLSEGENVCICTVIPCVHCWSVVYYSDKIIKMKERGEDIGRDRERMCVCVNLTLVLRKYLLLSIILYLLLQ